MGRGWGDHQASGQGFAAGHCAERQGGGKVHPGFPIGIHQGFHRPVQQDLLTRPAGLALPTHPEGGQFRQQPLRLAEGIGEQQRRPLRRRLPPAEDLAGHLRARAPAVDRQPKGGLADQYIGAHRFKRCAAGVGATFVVAAHQPAFAAGLQPDLGTSEHMAGAVERHPGIAEAMELAILHRQQLDRGSQPLAQDALAGPHRPVLTATGPGMVGVGVGDQGTGHRPPGVDPGPCHRAVQALGGEGEQAVGAQGHGRQRLGPELRQPYDPRWRGRPGLALSGSSPAFARWAAAPGGASPPPARSPAPWCAGSARASPGC